MIDLRERFGHFRDVEAPDDWDRIESLALVKAAPQERKMRPLVAATAAAVVVLAVVGGGFFLLLRQDGAPSPTADQPAPAPVPTPTPTVQQPPVADVPEGPAPPSGPGTTVATFAPPDTAAPEPSTAAPGLVPVSNNGLGTGPAVFAGVDGTVGAFVPGFDPGDPPTAVVDLVTCADATCASAQTMPLPALGGHPAVDPLVLGDGSLGGVVLTEEGALQLAVCSDAACTEATVTLLADAAQMWNATIADDGALVVVFSLPWGESLEPPETGLVVCADPTCADPQVTMLGDLWPPDPMFSRIAVSDGRLAYAYRTGDAAVHLATCSDLSCDGLSTVEVVPPAGSSGWLDVFDLAVGSDGRPIIAFGWMGEPRELRLVHCEDWECTRRSVETVDDLTGRWQGPSLAVGHDGFPVMAYADNESITVAKCEDAACASAVISTPLGVTPGDPSLIVGNDGNPVIAYFLADPAPIDSEANPDIPMPDVATAFVRCVDTACAVPVG